jgi:hypothetical protein
VKDFADRIVMAVLDGLTVLGALAAGWLLFQGAKADSMVATAGLAATALGVLAVPYCLSALYHRILTRERWRQMD